MTDTPSVPPTPETSAGAYAPGPAVKQTRSLVAFIFGIAAFLFAAVPLVNFLAFCAGVAAVVLGFRARKSEPQAPQWMSLVGIIGGFAGIALSLVFGIVYLIGLIPFWFLAQCGTSVC